MKTEQTKEKSFKSLIKGFFTKNVMIKIISLLFAMLLWGYVMMDQNPSRIKTVSDVAVSFDGEADLLARQLVVRGNREELLESVSARISTELTNYADLTADNVRATISLRNVSMPGTYNLPITATTANGTVLTTSPDSVQIEIDSLATRKIPVELLYDASSLPTGYWGDEPTLGRAEIEIQGASQDVAMVTKAICTLDLSERTQSIYESVELTLLDADGNEISSSLFLNELPSVTVTMSIYRAVALPVDVDAVVLGQNNLPENYEIIEIVSSPASVTVVGEESQLEEYTALDIQPVNVSGRTESLLAELEITIPEGLTLLGDSTVSVYVNIRQIRQTITYATIPIEIQGLSRSQNGALSAETVTVVATGPISIMNRLQRGDITAFVDASALENGVYELPVKIEFSTEEQQQGIYVELSVENVTITVTGN